MIAGDERAHLAVEDLQKIFTLHLLGGREVVALRDVTFSVERGEFLAIVGGSGSGKSTLVRCLYRTYLATGGALHYRLGDGQSIDLAAAGDDDIISLRGERAELGYVSQFLRPTPRVTAVDLVATSLVVRGVARDEAREEATSLLRRLGLPAELCDAYPVFFSGGEQQRVNIARALIALPRLLLLDEPTSALDSANQQIVMRLLREARDRGVTVIGVFHDLPLVRQEADRFLHMQNGRVADRGPAAMATLDYVPAG